MSQPAENPGPPPAACTLFAVELRTTQWEALVRWYREILGLRVALRVEEDRYALLLAEGTRLAILERPVEAPPSPCLVLVFEVADLAAIERTLADAGVAFEGPRHHAEGFSDLKLTDPDGNSLRLFAWPA